MEGLEASHGDQVPGRDQSASQRGLDQGADVWVTRGLTHPDGRQVTIPGGGKSSKDVPAGTLASIRRDTGLEPLR